jgi:hypothetical protein
MRLSDIAQVIRSKNAGPRTTTLDIIFAQQEDYERVCRSGAISAASVGILYDIAADAVRVIDYPDCRAIKITLPRKLTAGDPGDRDVYGAQQHARLFGVLV